MAHSFVANKFVHENKTFLLVGCFTPNLLLYGLLKGSDGVGIEEMRRN